MNMLDRHNEHKFLEHQDLNENSFIANVNKTVTNIAEIKKFNDYIEEGEVAKLVEAILVDIEETGNKWLVQLQEVALALTAAKSAFNFATLVTIPEDIASGAEIELPDLAQYTVGTHMLMVSYNGTTCYIGEQYEEIGEIGETSKKIRMLFDLRANDKIMFRVIALNSETVLGKLPVRAEGSTEYRTLEKRFGDVVSVKDFGAIGDGVHDDTAAIHEFFSHLSTTNCSGFIPSGEYLVTSGIHISNANGLSVFGDGESTVIQYKGVGNAFNILNCSRLSMRNFVVNCNESNNPTLNGGGFSIGNPNQCELVGIHVRDYYTFGILMFLSEDVLLSSNKNVDGTYRDNFIINCMVDGNGVGNNGILLANMYSSGILNCHATNLNKSGTPSYGLQLKNNCRYSYIRGGFAENCRAGAAFGSDGDAIGDGCYYCDISGVSTSNCVYGVIAGKTTSCKISAIINMHGENSLNAVNVSLYNVFLTIDVCVHRVPSGKTAIKITSSGTQVATRFPDGIPSNAYIAELTEGVENCYISINGVYGRSAITNMYDFILNNSAATNNTIVIPQTGDMSGDAYLRFRTPVTPYSYLSYSSNTNAISMRVPNTTIFTATEYWLHSSSDNIRSCGRASYRWSVIYAGTGSINTSDARYKSKILEIDDEVLDAWGDVSLRTFVFNDAVAIKDDSARIHTGVIAQQIIEAFAKHGLDATRYGLLCYDEWEDEYETVAVESADGTVSMEPQLVCVAGNRYGVRYEEALVLEAAYQRRENEKLKNELTNLQIRLNVLESKLGG